MSQPVARWVQEPVQPPVLENNQEYSCPVCLDSQPPFWAHQTVVLRKADGTEQTFYGSQHPVHPACIREWVNRNATCPTCRVPTVDLLVGPQAKVARFTENTVKNMLQGAKHSEINFLYGTLAVAMIAALELSGYTKAKEVAMIAGYGYGLGAFFGALFGIYSRWNNASEIATEQEVAWSSLSIKTGVICGAALSLSGKLLCDPITVALGVLFFVKGAGYKDVATGALVGGGISALAARSLSWIGVSKKMAAAIGGASTALVQYQSHHPAVIGVSVRTAWTIAGVAYTALQSYRSVWLAGAIAGAWAVMSTRHIERGRESYRYISSFF